MNERQLFLVSGFSRGGTNILWNMICSHPNVLSTGLELNEIFGPSRTNISMYWKTLIEGFAIPGLPIPRFICDYTADRVIDFAEAHAKNSWGSLKKPGEVYTTEEISELPICTKSVNSWSPDLLFSLMKRNIALKYNDLLLGSFGSVKTIYLIRDSESQCNGWMRRGCNPYEAGKWYRKIVEIMLQDYAKRPNDIMFVKFHDLLMSPLITTSKVYEFIGLDKLELSNFHLKLKKVLKADGKHEVLRGTEGDMVWVPNTELDIFLDPGVDNRQRQNLSSAARSQFQQGLGDIVELLEEVFTI